MPTAAKKTARIVHHGSKAQSDGGGYTWTIYSYNEDGSWSGRVHGVYWRKAEAADAARRAGFRIVK
jgi:hypothetical protein